MLTDEVGSEPFDLEPEPRRALSLRAAYDVIASDLLRDQEPGLEPFELLSLVVVDATLAGARCDLYVVREALMRLQAYLPEGAAWREPWEARLQTLRQSVELARSQLLSEYRQAA